MTNIGKLVCIYETFVSVTELPARSVVRVSVTFLSNLNAR